MNVSFQQMPLKKFKAIPDKPVLENGTYICSAFNSRCFIIQKVSKVYSNIDKFLENICFPTSYTYITIYHHIIYYVDVEKYRIFALPPPNTLLCICMAVDSERENIIYTYTHVYDYQNLKRPCHAFSFPSSMSPCLLHGGFANGPKVIILC